MKRLFFLITLGLLGGYLFRSFAFEGIYIASASMAPTLYLDRHVLVDKFSLLVRSPRRGEIVMFDSPVEPGKGLVKRVIAVGGDEVEIRQKQVILNGQPLTEPYVQYLNPGVIYKGDNMPPMRVPRRTVFVLGDNRDVSGDSRDWKNAAGEGTPFLPLSSIKGVVRP